MKKNKAPKARVRRYYNQNMKDRLPQYPNRYKVSGLGDNIDIIANPGTIGDATAMPMSGENIQKLEKGVEAIDTALLNLENLSDKFALLDGTRGFTDPLLIKPTTSTGSHMVNFDMTSHPSLKTSTIDSLYVYGGLTSQYGGDYVGLRVNLKDAASSDTYLIARSRTSSAGVKYLSWEMSTKYNDTDYLKNLNHLAAIGNLYNADGSLNSTLGSKITAFQNNKYIHDGSLGSADQKVDLASGKIGFGLYDSNDVSKPLAEIQSYAQYLPTSSNGGSYRSYAGFRLRFKKKDGTYKTGRYLDFMVNDLDEERLDYSRDTKVKKFNSEVAVVGDIYDTSKSGCPRFVDRKIIDPAHPTANNTLVWKGGTYLGEGQIAKMVLPYLTGGINMAPRIVLKFSDFDSENNAVKNYDVHEYNVTNTGDSDYGGASLDQTATLVDVPVALTSSTGGIVGKTFHYKIDQVKNELQGFTSSTSTNYNDCVLREIWIINQ